MEDYVSACKMRATMCKDTILKTLAFVPDDKLTWSPSETAKSALRIAAHAGVSNHSFAGMLRGEKLPGASMEEIFAHIDAAEKAVTSREQAVQLIEDSTGAVIAALDALTPEMIGSEIVLPFITAPMTFFMDLPGSHMASHAAQIDYLQTIWGDNQPHM